MGRTSGSGRVPDYRAMADRWPDQKPIRGNLSQWRADQVLVNPSRKARVLVYAGIGAIITAVLVYVYRKPIVKGAETAYQAAKESVVMIYDKVKISELLRQFGHLPLPQAPVEAQPPALARVYPSANTATKSLLDTTPLAQLWGVEGFYNFPADTASINSTRKIAENAQQFVQLAKPAVLRVTEKYPFENKDVAAKSIIAQAGHEGGWGKSAIGGTNIFGHVATEGWTKNGGRYSFEKTWEWDSKRGKKVETVRPFRVYADLDSAFDHHVELITRKWPGVLKAKTAAEYAEAVMKKPAYATDPDYVSKLDAVYATVNRYW